MTTENIWWLLHPTSKQLIAAYEVNNSFLIIIYLDDF